MDFHLFGTTILDSCVSQNQIFIENKIVQIEWDIVAYFWRKKKKKGFDFNDSKWIFEIYFQRDLLRKIFSFKMKKKLIWKQQNIRTKIPRKQNHKVKFFTTKQTKVVRVEANFQYFPNALEKSN